MYKHTYTNTCTHILIDKVVSLLSSDSIFSIFGDPKIISIFPQHCFAIYKIFTEMVYLHANPGIKSTCEKYHHRIKESSKEQYTSDGGGGHYLGMMEGTKHGITASLQSRQILVGNKWLSATPQGFIMKRLSPNYWTLGFASSKTSAWRVNEKTRAAIDLWHVACWEAFHGFPTRAQTALNQGGNYLWRHRSGPDKMALN